MSFKGIGRFAEERGYGESMNVGLAESERQAVFGERFLDAEEFEVVAVDDGEFLGSVFEDEREDGDFGALDVRGRFGIRAFGSDAAFFAGDDQRRILDPVKQEVTDFLQDIVNRDRGAGFVEMTAAAVAIG